MEPKFVHLRTHSEFSLRDGLLLIPDMMEKAAACRMPAIAITDLCNLYATVKFYQAAIGAGIKPIIGVDVFVRRDDKVEAPYRLTLLCQTNEGYQNLLKLISKSFLEGQQGDQPEIRREWLEPLTKGLIALSGAQYGDIGQALLANDTRKAAACHEYWQQLFPNRFYLEISRVVKRKKKLIFQQREIR